MTDAVVNLKNRIELRRISGKTERIWKKFLEIFEKGLDKFGTAC